MIKNNNLKFSLKKYSIINHAKVRILILFILLHSASYSQYGNNDDYDGDGVINSVDIDDDNDGVLDNIECVVNVINYNFTNSSWIKNGSTTLNGYETTLTNASSGQNGSIYNSTKLDLDYSFEITFEANFGNRNDGIFTNGGDGIAFVLQNTSAYALGVSGGGIGYEGITPSFEIEFDDFSNQNDPTSDHCSYVKNGDVYGAKIGSTYSFSSNIEDGLWHSIKITWNPVTKNIETFFDNIFIKDENYDLINLIFGGNDKVYFGLSASTGSAYNLQRVRNFLYTSTQSSITNCDYDNDGIPNSFDLDSDGDGCSDMAESNAGLIDENLVTQSSNYTSVGSNGFANNFETSNGSGIINYISTYNSFALNSNTNICVDFDGDNVSDFLDLDSDNDGVPNSIEGNMDFDNDGQLNIYDLDSDNDGCSDMAESGSGLITNSIVSQSSSYIGDGKNGLANHLETNIDNGIINYISKYDDFANDSNLNNCSDYDNDNVGDLLDLDDDNDGVPDLIEMCINTNNVNNIGGLSYSKYISVSSPIDHNYSNPVSGVQPYDYFNSTDSYGLPLLDLKLSDINSNNNLSIEYTGKNNLQNYPYYGTDYSNKYEAHIFEGYIKFPINIVNTNILFRNYTTSGTNVSNVFWVISKDENPANWIDPIHSNGVDYLLDMNNLSQYSGYSNTITRPLGVAVNYNYTYLTNTRDLQAINSYYVATKVNMKGNYVKIYHLDPIQYYSLLKLQYSIDEGLTWIDVNSTMLNTINSTLCDNDIDNDGIPNHLDLDSDNDGCSDMAESNSGFINDSLVNQNILYTGSGTNGLADHLEVTIDNGIINYNSIYNIYAINSGLNACADSDGDGIGDINDIDDDNDGVSDYLESDKFTCNSKINWGSFANNNAGAHPGVTTPINGTLTHEGVTYNYTADMSGTARMWDESGTTHGGYAVSANSTVNYGVTNSSPYSIQFEAVGTITVTFDNPVTDPVFLFGSINGRSIQWPAGTELVYQYQNNFNTSTLISSNASGEASMIAKVKGTGTTYNFGILNAEFRSSLNVGFMCNDTIIYKDTDNDGIPNHLDLDSDGDACSDMAESNSGLVTDSLVNQNSSYVGVGTNGLADHLETTVDNGVINYNSTYNQYAINSGVNACADSDGDGIGDINDIDDDNDGVIDYLEENNKCVTSDNCGGMRGNDSWITWNSGGSTTNWTGKMLLNGQDVVDVQLIGNATLTTTNNDIWNNSKGPINSFCPGNNPNVSLLPGFSTIGSWKLIFSKKLKDPIFHLWSYGGGGGMAPMQIGGNFPMTKLSNGANTNFNVNQSLHRLDGITTYAQGSILFTGEMDTITFSTTQAESWWSINVSAGVSSYLSSCINNLDTDGDGILNHLDLDSDGDGCSDMAESNSGLVTDSLVNQNASYVGVGTNGLADHLETNTDNGTINYTTTYNQYALDSTINVCTDTDGDGIGDLFDIDDDNDGVIDNDECKAKMILPISSNQSNYCPNCATSDPKASATLSATEFVTNPIDQFTSLKSSVYTNYISGSFYFGNHTYTSTDLTYNFAPTKFDEIIIWNPDFKNPGYNHDDGGIRDFDLIITHGTGVDTVTGFQAQIDWEPQIFNFGMYENITQIIMKVKNSWRQPGDNGPHYPALSPSDVSSSYNITLYEFRAKTSNILAFCDNDGDGISNQLDLDSDNDGCSDAVESGTTVSTTQNFSHPGPFGNNGLQNSLETPSDSGKINYNLSYYYAIDTNFKICTDTDKDSILDYYDIDDDNDGILDSVESPSCFFKTNDLLNLDKSSFAKVSSELTLYGANSISMSIDGNFTDLSNSRFVNIQDLTNKVLYKVEFSLGITLDKIRFRYSSGTNTIFNNSNIKLQASNDSLLWIDLNNGSIYTNISATSYNDFNVTQNSNRFKYYRLFANSGTTNSLGFFEAEFHTPSNFESSLNPKPNCNVDTDNDNTYNHLDLDSDNDGCSDANEGGSWPIISSNYSFIPPYTNNGLADILETFVDSDTINYILNYNDAILSTVNACDDNDGDGIGNKYDIDDDNDGILDTTEMSCGMHLDTIDISTLTWHGDSKNIVNFSSKSFEVNDNDNSWTSVYSDQLFSLPFTMEFTTIYTSGLNMFGISSKQHAENSSWNGNGVKFYFPSASDVRISKDASASVYFTTYNNTSKFKINVDATGNVKAYINGSQVYTTTFPNDSIKLYLPTNQVSSQIFNFDLIASTKDSIYTCINIDTDNDGIPNVYDLDSDNDGCSDALEAGATTSKLPNYEFLSNFGMNGLANAVESNNDSDIINYISMYDPNAVDSNISDCPKYIILPTDSVPQTSTTTICDIDAYGIPAQSVSLCDDGDFGSVTQSGNCFIYTADSNYVGNDTMCMVVCISGVCDTVLQPIVIIPNGKDTLPLISIHTDSSVSLCDSELVIFEVDTIKVCDGGNNGTVSNNNNCLTYTPNNNYYGMDTICILVCNDGVCDTLIQPIKIVPSILPIDTVNPDSTIDICDTSIFEVPSDSISVCDGGNNGITINNGNCLTYTPNNNYIGNDTICVYICLGGTCDTILKPIVVGPGTIDTLPSVTTLIDSSISICENNLNLGYNIDSISICDGGDNGNTIDNGNCLSYTPNSGFFGDDTICILVCNDGICNTYIQPIIVDSLIDDTLTTIVIPQDSTLTLCDNYLIGVSAQIVAICNEGDNGTTTDIGNCITYTPNSNYVGNDTLCIIVCSAGNCDSLIQPIVVIPNGVDTLDPITTPIDTPITLCGNVLTGFNPDDVKVCDGGDNGNTIDNGNCITYTPNSNYFGNDTICIQICNDGICDTLIQPIIVGPGITITLPIDTINVNNNLVLCDNDIYSALNSDSMIICNTGNNGITIDSSNCSIYSPNNNYFGKDTICIIVCNDGICNTYIQPIVIIPVDTMILPIETIIEDTKLTLCGDSIINGNSDDISICNGGNNGSTIDNGKCVTYTPNPNYIGLDTICVSICNDGICQTVIQPIMIIPDGNDTMPVKNIYMDSNYKFCDIEFIGDNSNSVTLCGAGDNGNTIDNGNCVTYTPNNNYVGPDTICLIICNDGKCDIFIQPINVIPLNQLPNDTIFENTNDTICDLDAIGITAQLVSICGSGDNGLTYDIGKCIVYKPNNNFIGLDTICILICNNGICDSLIQPIVIISNGKDILPVDTITNDSTLATCEMEIVGFDADQIIICDAGSNGISVVNGNCIDYTPNTNYIGKDTICIIACNDGICDTNIQPIVIIPNGIDTLTVDTITNDSTLSTCEFELIGFDAEQLFICNGGNDGNSIINGNCVEYSPNNNYVGFDTICIMVCNDGICETNIQPIVVISNGIDTLPVDTTIEDSILIVCEDTLINTNADSLSICNQGLNGNSTENEDCITYVSNSNYFGNDTICVIACNDGICDTNIQPILVLPNGKDTLNTEVIYVDSSLSLCDNNIFGTNADDLDLCATGNNGNTIDIGNCVIYTPNSGYVGKDTICLVVCNDEFCDTFIQPIVIIPLDTLPTIFTIEDDNIVICDTDIYGFTTTSVSVCDGGQNGNTVDNGNCLNYSPNPNYIGKDTICIIVCENTLCDTFIQPIIVLGIVDTMRDTIFEQNTISICDNNLNNILADNVYVLSNASNGNAVDNGNCITYTPNINYIGNDTLTIVVCNDAICDTTIEIITVNSIKDTISKIIKEDSSFVICDLNLINTVGDTVYVCNDGENGTVEINNNCFEYIPNSGFVGKDDICLIVCNDGICDTTIVKIIVQPKEIDTFTLIIKEDEVLDICDSTIYGYNISSVTLCNNPENGIATDMGNCINYVPNSNYFGLDTICVIFCNNGDCDTSIIEIKILPDNNDSILEIILEDSIVLIDDTLINTSIDLNNNITILNGPNFGYVNIDSNNNITYIPSPNYFGIDTFDIIVCNDGMCDTSHVTIIILPVTDTITEILQPLSLFTFCIDGVDTVYMCDDNEINNGVLVINNQCIEYSAGILQGLDNFCIIVCNDVYCDTTIFGISVKDSNILKLICQKDSVIRLNSYSCEFEVIDFISTTTFIYGKDTILNNDLLAYYQTPNVGEKIVIENDTLNISVFGITNFYDTSKCEFNIFVRCNKILEIPEFISPNGDDYNDTWEIPELEKYPENTVKVYNRFGKLVFNAVNYSSGWDGKPSKNGLIKNDDKLPSGTYFFVIKLNDKEEPIVGQLNIQY